MNTYVVNASNILQSTSIVICLSRPQLALEFHYDYLSEWWWEKEVTLLCYHYLI